MFKKVVLCLVLSAILSIIYGCDGATATPETKPEFKSEGYPPAPTALMQAKLTKLDGGTIRLQDLKGKVLLVNVWATWCGPCRDEVPELIKLQNKHQAKGFEVIGLNVDENETPDMIKEFGKELNINYQLVTAETELFKEFYQVSKRDAIPQSLLIDREGKLIGVFVGGGSALKKLVAGVEKVVGG